MIKDLGAMKEQKERKPELLPLRYHAFLLIIYKLMITAYSREMERRRTIVDLTNLLVELGFNKNEVKDVIKRFAHAPSPRMIKKLFFELAYEMENEKYDVSDLSRGMFMENQKI